MPTVLWLANLEVPDPQLRVGRENRLPYSAVTSLCALEPWEKIHVVVIFILK